MRWIVLVASVAHVACVAGAGLGAPHPRASAATRSPPPRSRAPGRCHRPPPAVRDAVAKTLAARFEPTRTDGEPSIGFGCDRLGVRIEEIVLERGSGHGGSLELWRARLVDDAFEIQGIIYQGDSMFGRAASPPFALVRGSIPRAQLERDIETARAALSARVEEVAPPDPPGTIGGFRAVVSSMDFHAVVQLVDRRGAVLEGSYTGYVSNTDQDRQLSVVLAVEALERITALEPTGAPPDDADHELFADRFVAAVPRFDEPFYWWVMERYVDLARFLGTTDTIPGLLGRLAFDKPDRSKVDARRAALDALARVTGWDARVDAAGVRRSDDEAAAAYLARWAGRTR